MWRHTDPAPVHVEHARMVEAITAGDNRSAQQRAERHAGTTIAHAMRTGARG